MKTKDTDREMNNDYNTVKKIDEVLLNSKKVLEEEKDRKLTELRKSYESQKRCDQYFTKNIQI